MIGEGKQRIVMSVILMAVFFVSCSLGMKNMEQSTDLGLPTNMTQDFGKAAKPGVEVIMNKLDDQRLEKWWMELSMQTVKHIYIDPSIDLPGQISGVISSELERANFKVIRGSNQTDPIRPVLSGVITNYSVVLKQVCTGKISLDMTLTKGDTVLIKKTYVGVVTKEPDFSWLSHGQENSIALLREAWDKLLSQMMPEVIETINKNW